MRQHLLKKNDLQARALRDRFCEAGVFVVSLVSSPGAGKTAFLERTRYDNPLFDTRGFARDWEALLERAYDGTLAAR